MSMDKNTLNLIASENIQSPLSRVLHLSSFSERYYLANDLPPPESSSPYPIDPHWVAIQTEGNKILNDLFGAEWSDPRPLSGTHAMLCLLGGLTKPGDRIFISPESMGGHFATNYIAKKLGLEVFYNSYDPKTYGNDVETSARQIQKIRPALVTLDVSHLLFPHPVTDLKSLIPPEIILTYDASHVLGLIAGGQLQRPLEEGADLLHGSTHKTFPAAQKALFLGKDPTLKAKIDAILFPKFSSNNHLHHTLSVFATALEMKYFGKEYAVQVIRNAKALATSLYDLGLPVLAEERGFTKTHQVWLDLEPTMVAQWNHNGIRATAFYIPGTHCQKSGIRLGTALLTRLGLNEQDMKTVAHLLWSGIHATGPSERLRKRILSFLKNRSELKFCFHSLESVRSAGKIGRLLAEQIERENLVDCFYSLVQGSMGFCRQTRRKLWAA